MHRKTVAMDMVAVEAGPKRAFNVPAASAPIRSDKNGKFAIINVMEPKIVNGKASMNESRRI